MELGWVIVSELSVVGSFDASVDAAVAFDYAGVGSVSAGGEATLLYFLNGFAEGVVETVRGKSPPGW